MSWPFLLALRECLAAWDRVKEEDDARDSPFLDARCSSIDVATLAHLVFRYFEAGCRAGSERNAARCPRAASAVPTRSFSPEAQQILQIICHVATRRTLPRSFHD